jgi:hypothetical protein
MENAMNHIRIVVLGLLLMASGLPALADCPANGRMYQTGDMVGDYQCQPDGSWKRVERR